MRSDDGVERTEVYQHATAGVGRRDALRALGAAGAAGTGLTALSGTVSACSYREIYVTNVYDHQSGAWVKVATEDDYHWVDVPAGDTDYRELPCEPIEQVRVEPYGDECTIAVAVDHSAWPGDFTATANVNAYNCKSDGEYLFCADSIQCGDKAEYNDCSDSGELCQDTCADVVEASVDSGVDTFDISGLHYDYLSWSGTPDHAFRFPIKTTGSYPYFDYWLSDVTITSGP
jgi:hypothetical protein